MKKVFGLLILTMWVTSASAQLTSGLTHQPDTSFTNYSAFQKAKKQYPNIALVKDSMPPGVKADKNLNYTNLDGQKLPVDVFAPKEDKRRLKPAIIIVHGGGWRSGNRTQHYPLAGRLAEKGYVCFTPAYRLSTEALYPAAVQDLKAAIHWVRINAKKFSVDTNRIAILGFSAGGQLATLLGTTAKDTLFSKGKFTTPVQAIVDIDGTLAFIHPESGESNDSKSISAATYWFGYSKTERPDLLNQASALNHAGPDTPPTVFINSSLDRMHAGRTDYINILNKYHIYTEVHAFPDSPHAFCLLEPWFTPTVNYITAFLDKVLK